MGIGKGEGRFRVSAPLVWAGLPDGDPGRGRSGAAGELDDGDLDVAQDRHDGVANSFHPATSSWIL
jgi:hypothetical protein